MIGQRSSDYVRSLRYFKLNLSSVDHVLDLIFQAPTIIYSMPRAVRVISAAGVGVVPDLDCLAHGLVMLEPEGVVRFQLQPLAVGVQFH